MSKKQGRVRNFIVQDVDLFLDVFERVLCREQISYVHVDNEIHCMDKIFRFYDLKQFEELYGFVRFTGEEDGIVKLADPFMMSLARSSEDINIALYLNEDEMVDCSFDKKEESFRFTKKDIKRESALCKQKIKSNKGYQGRIINRNRKDL